MAYLIIVLLLIFIIFSFIQRRKEKRQEKRELLEFFERGERLTAQFNQIAARNIDLLEEKIKEAREVIQELTEKEERIKNKRFSRIFMLKDEGFETEEIAKIMKMGKQEIELILKQ